MKKLLLSVVALGFVMGSNAMAAGNRPASPAAKKQEVRKQVQKTCNKRAMAFSPFSREGKLTGKPAAPSKGARAVTTRSST